MYKKRNKMPKTWPIPRKGSKYVAAASHAQNKGIPLLFALRDILKIVKTRKEAKYIAFNGDIKVNNRIRKNEMYPLQVFDVMSLDKSKKNYRLEIVNRKFKLVEVSGKDVDKKIVKVVGKNILGKNKIQMNLEDGQNFITKEKFSVGDSAIINTKENNIEKILALKSGAKVELIAGKHAGEKGVVKNIEVSEKNKVYLIKLKDREIRVPLKTLLVIG